MPVIQIPFTRSLENVSTSHGRITVGKTHDTASSLPQSNANAVANPNDKIASAARRTLDTISAQLQRLDVENRNQVAAAEALIVAAATQIAKEALNSENTLIEERVSHFAEVLLRQNHPNQSPVLFVNPDCVDYLNMWLSESKHPPIEIQADAAVQPGDCRIELDDKGFLASLESFLDAAAKRSVSGLGGI